MDTKKNKSGFGETNKKKKNTNLLSPKEIELKKNEAAKMILKNRADKAELIYLKLLKKGIEEINIYEKLFRIYINQKRYLEAIKIFKKLINFDSKYAILSIELSNFLLKKGDIESAVQILSNAVNVNPFDENILAYYGKLMIEIGYESKAIEKYKNLLKINPNSFICNSNLGFISFKLKKFTTAIQFYKKALLNYPENIDLLNNLGSCYLEKKDYELAIGSFKKTLS